MVMKCRAVFVASAARRTARSGWIRARSPVAFETPAMRMRSRVRREWTLKRASNTAATRIDPRSCGSVARARAAGSGGDPSAVRSAPPIPSAAPNCGAISSSGLALARSARISRSDVGASTSAAMVGA